MENIIKEELKYPWRLSVEYQTMEEYQTQLVSVMNINDEGEHVKILDNLYEHTKNEERIMELCLLASDKYLLYSEAEYGQIMMFSYDCFAKFHSILQWNFGGGSEEKANESYEWLKNYFSKTPPSLDLL